MKKEGNGSEAAEQGSKAEEQDREALSHWAESVKGPPPFNIKCIQFLFVYLLSVGGELRLP